MVFRLIRITHNQYAVQRELLNGTWAQTSTVIDNIADAYKEFDHICHQVEADKTANKETGWREIVRRDV